MFESSPSANSKFDEISRSIFDPPFNLSQHSAGQIPNLGLGNTISHLFFNDCWSVNPRVCSPLPVSALTQAHYMVNKLRFRAIASFSKCSDRSREKQTLTGSPIPKAHHLASEFSCAFLQAFAVHSAALHLKPWEVHRLCGHRWHRRSRKSTTTRTALSRPRVPRLQL